MKKENAEFRMQSAEGGSAGRSQNIGSAEARQRTSTREAPKIGIKGLKAGGVGKRWVGKRVSGGRCGHGVEEWTSFTHIATASTRLSPDNSTQVVDFPHLAMVSQAKLGTSMENGVMEHWSNGREDGNLTEPGVMVEKGVSECWGGGFWRKMVVLNYTYLHEFTAFYTRSPAGGKWSVGVVE